MRSADLLDDHNIKKCEDSEGEFRLKQQMLSKVLRQAILTSVGLEMVAWNLSKFVCIKGAAAWLSDYL